MSSPPLQTQVGDDLYDALEAMTWADQELGWPFAYYLDSLGLILEETAYVVRADDDGHDGWSAFAEPDRVPIAYLYTLAQWAGVRYPRRMNPEQLRTLIDGNAPGLWRGTKAALLAAIRRYLTPGASVYWEERADGNPYAIRIFTYTTQTLDETAIRKELAAQLPAGLLLTYEVRAGQDYDMLRDRVKDYAEVKATWATYKDVHLAPPPPEP